MLYSFPVATTGVDTSAGVNATQASAVRARGLKFIIRSLICPDSSIHPVAVTPAERDILLGADLAIGFYQMFQTAKLTPAQGDKDGKSAVLQLTNLGAPRGMTIYGDSEGQAFYSAQEDIDYWNAWSLAVKGGGFTPGLYVGPGPKMTGAQLGALPNVHAYWQSASFVPTPTPRGYQMYQLNPPNVVIAGRAFDLNCVQQDYRNTVPMFWKGLAMLKSMLIAADPWNPYCKPTIVPGKVPIECYSCFRCFYLIRKEFDKANLLTGHTDVTWDNYIAICRQVIGICDNTFPAARWGPFLSNRMVLWLA